MTGAGDLRSMMIFSERVASEDGAGNWQDGWLDRLVRRAQIQPARGSEALDATRSEGRGMVTIRIRRDPEAETISSDWKARDAVTGFEYNIRSSIDPYMGGPQHGQWIMLSAEFGRATG